MKIVDIGLKIYRGIVFLGNALQSPFLLLVRIIWGYQFFKSGLGKLSNLSTVVEFFESLNIPFPTLNAALVGSIECLGGLCLLFGVLSRFASIPLFCVMATALATADYEALSDAYNNFAHLLERPPMTFLMAVLIIFVFGPGKYSVDYMVESNLNPNPKNKN